MSTLIWIVLALAIVFLLPNLRTFARLFRRSERKQPEEQIYSRSGEFALLKPAGFTQRDTASTLMLEIYSDSRQGIIGEVGGEMIKEEFNSAWAVVSVTPGDGIELCREIAKNRAIDIVSEVETQQPRTLTITVQKKSTHFTIETTHRVVVSPQYNKTYELRASVLVSKKAEFGEDVSRMVESFQIV